jgi:putative sporulation protein YtxC
MVLLTIGFASGKCDIYERLRELSNYFKEKGIVIGVVESDSNDMHFIKCIIRDEDTNYYSISEIKKVFNVYASNMLYQIIVDNFQIDVLKKIIKDNYYYFKEEEAFEIVNKCMNILNGSAGISGQDYLFYKNRQDKITQKILEYVDDNTDIILEGFLRFRLKEITKDLESIVDRVVEDYLVEREYNEFIKLLKYFVEIQESQVETVNIVINMDGSYSMYDNKSNEITQELLNDLTNEGFNGEVNRDDLLVSSLITAAPGTIVFHNISNARNKEIIETIRSVFCDRVKLCNGCDMCLKQTHIHKV